MRFFFIASLLLCSSVLCGAARFKFRSATFLVDTPSPKQAREIWSFVARNSVFLPQALGRFDGYASMAELAREQGIFGASRAEIERDGGSVAKRLVALIPADFAPQGFRAVIDVLVFSLAHNDRLIFLDYEGYPRTDLHLPTDTMHGEELMPYMTTDGYFSTAWIKKVGNTESIRKLRELWMSVASHQDGVSHTTFLPNERPYVDHPTELVDGEILLVSSLNPRYELKAFNRGLRLMLRVRLVPASDKTPSRPIRQQYLHAPVVKDGR